MLLRLLGTAINGRDSPNILTATAANRLAAPCNIRSTRHRKPVPIYIDLLAMGKCIRSNDTPIGLTSLCRPSCPVPSPLDPSKANHETCYFYPSYPFNETVTVFELSSGTSCENTTEYIPQPFSVDWAVTHFSASSPTSRFVQPMSNNSTVLLILADIMRRNSNERPWFK
jgi:hypothetical protein